MSGRGSNFEYLATYDAQLVRLGALAELRFHDAPNSCLIKLRQFAELLAQQLAARMGYVFSSGKPFADLLTPDERQTLKSTASRDDEGWRSASRRCRTSATERR